MKLKQLVVISLVLACASNLTWAAETSTAPRGMDQQAGPPQEAFTACEGIAAGVAASFTKQSGETVNGTCQTDPRTGKQLLRPDNMGAGGQQPQGNTQPSVGGPPPQGNAQPPAGGPPPN